MKILYGIKKPLRLNKPIVTIGIFDGIHIGHQKLLCKLLRKARLKRKKSVVITFASHTYGILHPHKVPPMLFSLSHRLNILKKMGIDIVLVLNFTKQFSYLSAEEFIKKNLVKKLNIGELFIGENFKLGRERKGGISLLKKLSFKYGFKLNVIKCKKIKKKAISSTSIRKLVIDGELKKAFFRLGRRVSILGTVIKGNRRGRILGFPTSNLDLHHEAVPPAGVYAVLVKLDDKFYRGVLNIGFRPTFEKRKKERTVEVHIFDFQKNIYGKDLEIIFIKKIRDEKHFRYVDHLRTQIKRDTKKTLKILQNQNQKSKSKN